MPDKSKQEITTDTALAGALGITTKTLRAWRERFPHAPAGKDLAGWRSFMEMEGLGTGNNRVSKGREFWLTKAAEHRAELLALEVQQARGLTMPRSEVNRLLFTLAMRQRTILISALETTLPPRLDGLGAAEMRPLLKETAGTIIDAMRDCLNDFEIDYEAVTKAEEVA